MNFIIINNCAAGENYEKELSALMGVTKIRCRFLIKTDDNLIPQLKIKLLKENHSLPEQLL